MNSSTYTQFVASRRVGICEPIHQLGMWDDFNASCPSTSATMILEVEKCLEDQIPIMEKRLDNETEDTSHGTVGTSHRYEAETSKPIEKVLRRLAQNREAARKSRMRKKAYVQQLENSKLKLIQLEQELERARKLGLYVGGGLDPSQLSYSDSASSGTAAFDTEYGQWVEEQNRQTNDLRNALYHSQISEAELRIIVDACLNHYSDLFRFKATAAKADVLTPHLELLTEQQLREVCNLTQSCQQAEDALSQGMVKLHQILAEAVAAGRLGEGNYSIPQMGPAIEKLEALVRFVNQADHLRQETLQQMSRILNTHQAAQGLLALGEYFERLRVLSSQWATRLREPA
ncbi:unnamed protein product [Withania somnifera]